jgi:hypothetical protein
MNAVQGLDFAKELSGKLNWDQKTNVCQRIAASGFSVYDDER